MRVSGVVVVVSGCGSGNALVAVAPMVARLGSGGRDEAVLVDGNGDGFVVVLSTVDIRGCGPGNRRSGWTLLLGVVDRSG